MFLPNAWYLIPPMTTLTTAWWTIPVGAALFVPPGYRA